MFQQKKEQGKSSEIYPNEMGSTIYLTDNAKKPLINMFTNVKNIIYEQSKNMNKF